MREVIVLVPDNDIAEGAVRYMAHQMREGMEAAVLPVPPNVARSMEAAQIIDNARRDLVKLSIGVPVGSN
jgi:hypothetical protein